jgi:hypothetical protein
LQESGCTYRSGDGDDEEELAVLLGEKYGDFLLWIEDRLRAELAAQEGMEFLSQYVVQRTRTVCNTQKNCSNIWLQGNLKWKI